MTDLAKQLLKSRLDVSNTQRFLKDFQRYLAEKNKLPLEWSNFTPLKNSVVYEELSAPRETKKAKLLQELVVCKLNGGLGTSMQCTKPKSSIIVKDKKSFLELSLHQHLFLQEKWKVSIPFLLMNSFYTEQITKQKIQAYKNINFYCLKQSCYPRLVNLAQENYCLLDVDKFGDEAFYPPGHGDIFIHLQENLLHKFLEEGKKYLFLSNIDNLGATVSLSILKYLEETSCPFLIETVIKTKNDTKGGSLLKDCKTGRIKLLEAAQMEQISNWQQHHTQSKLTTFNTNNLWINLPALQKAMQQPSWKLDLIKNYKNIAGKNILQLETTMGSAIANFNGAQTIIVPRFRFLPVKKIFDLYLLRSERFILQKQKGYLLRAQKNLTSLPKVDLRGIDSIQELDKKYPV